jgi:hypothetical protein
MLPQVQDFNPGPPLSLHRLFHVFEFISELGYESERYENVNQ